MLTCYAQKAGLLLPHKDQYTIIFGFCQYFVKFCPQRPSKNQFFVNMTKIRKKYLREYRKITKKSFAFFSVMRYNIIIKL